jgi:L-fucose isomerase-like protein
MAQYTMPAADSPAAAVTRGDVLLVASGDLRPAANRVCWPAQKAMEASLTEAVRACGKALVRGHAYDEQQKHGFIGSQRQGMDVFRRLDPEVPLIVAEAVWQYSHHVLPGLTTHRGPILTVANWSGQWPGLVGMLNLNGSLTKAGVRYSTLWSEDFTTDATFRRKLNAWLDGGAVEHDLSHVTPVESVKIGDDERRLGEALAAQLRRDKAILGVFDEGCMGMFNAIIPDHLLHPTGAFKERLSQSSLYYETQQVTDDQAWGIYGWMTSRGMKFRLGSDEQNDLTERQVLTQCKMYAAALRIADDFGCSAIGIQYQQGLKDLLPASDLVEGMLNDSARPPVTSRDGARELYAGEPLPHFNEADECAGLDALMIHRIHRAMRQPVESTLHDLRWGDADRSGSTNEYVWVLQVSGAVPPSHLTGGWAGATGERQPPMYFRLGGSTIKGVSRPGEIVWSRIFVEGDRLNMDIGRGQAMALPAEETRRRWQSTTSQWPIMHAVTYGVSRDQMMARHKANHVQVAYAHSADEADAVAQARAAMARAMGTRVSFCGTRKGGHRWSE